MIWNTYKKFKQYSFVIFFHCTFFNINLYHNFCTGRNVKIFPLIVFSMSDDPRIYLRTYLVWRGVLCSQTPAHHWTGSWWQWCTDSEAYTWLCSPLPHGLSLSQSQFYHLQTQIRQILKMLCIVYKLELVNIGLF